MRRVDGRLVYSATDLVGYLECAHLANIERAAVWGHLNRPVRADPVLDRIAQRGIEYEQRFLESLRGDGATVVEVERHESLAYDERRIRGRDETVAAMRDGVDVIYQAVLFDERRFGYADFLRRVEQPSDLGRWSYEVWDTKLARHATASAVLQLCLYSDMVRELQGRQPEEMHLALGRRSGPACGVRSPRQSRALCTNAGAPMAVSSRASTTVHASMTESVSYQQIVGDSPRSRSVCTRRGWQTSTSAPSSTRFATHASRRSGGTASAFITATRSPCRKLVADVVTGKLDIREVASSLPNEEGADDWLEPAPLADSLDDDDHVSEDPAECSPIKSEVTA